jgi:uroporphyrinogen-III synthase
MRLLILRPEPSASATADKARALGLNAVTRPLFELQAVEWSAPATGFDGLLLTSANAVRFGGERLQSLRALPVYAVGETTADAARQAGFDIAVVGDSGVERLLGSIDPNLRLLHLCGVDRVEVDARQAITPVVVYRSKALDAPDLPTGDAVALIHSPRAGRRFTELVSDRSEIIVAAISSAAANAVGDGWKSVAIADQPSDQALLALAAGLCNKPHPK